MNWELSTLSLNSVSDVDLVQLKMECLLCACHVLNTVETLMNKFTAFLEEIPDVCVREKEQTKYLQYSTGIPH